MISTPPAFSNTGKRARHFFKTKVDAEAYAAKVNIQIANFGIQGGGVLPPSEAEQAQNAITLLQPYGVSLNTVVQDWVARQKARTATVSFKQAADEFQAWLEIRKIKGHPVSEPYKASVRQAFKRAVAFDEIPLTDIDPRCIGKACQGMKPNAKNTWLAIMSSLFEWASLMPRNWIESNPTKAVPRESVGSGEVQTFTAAEAKRILAACDSDDLTVYHAIGLFAGIRPWELERMEWGFINLTEKAIVMPATSAKTRTRRVVEITDALASWLEWIIARNGIQSGPIISTVNLRKRLRAVRKASGVKWIHDGMRHTYASNWLAEFKDEHKLRANLGHKSSGELWDHYHKATTEKEAAEFWAIRPEKRKIVKFRKGVAA